MKTVISMPNVLLVEAERLAERLGVSRSELFRRALVSFLQNHDEKQITEMLNIVYGSGGNESHLSSALERMQIDSLDDGKW